MRFDMICEANGIEHRLTKPNHPWTNGQVERMNRTIKDATTKAFNYPDRDAVEAMSWPSSPPTTPPSTSPDGCPAASRRGRAETMLAKIAQMNASACKIGLCQDLSKRRG